MSFKRRGRSAVLGLLLLVIVVVPVWRTWREFKQERLNVALIRAIKRTDSVAAVGVLEAGAIANFRDNGTLDLSFWQWLRMYFSPRPSIVLPTPTALEVALYVPLDLDSTYVESTNQRLPIIKALLDHHADPNVSTKASENAGRPVSMLFYAVDINHAGLADLLLQHGANPNITESRESLTPLMRAAFYPNPSLVSQLLTHGADVNAEQKYGRTALMIACEAGNEMSVRLLLGHHADINHRSRFSQTALEAARTHHNQPLIHLLLQAGAKP